MIVHKAAQLTGLVPFAVCAVLLVALPPVSGQAPAYPPAYASAPAPAYAPAPAPAYASAPAPAYSLAPASASAQAYPPAPEQGEVKAVARISKKLIEDVAARKEVVATIPYNAIVLGFHCQGVIDGRANLSVDMKTAQGAATFIVNSQGTGQTYVRGVRGPIAALGPASGPFTSRTVVQFDGRKFTVAETTPWAQVHGELDCVEGRHGGLAGRAVGRVLLPFGRMLVPHAEVQAKPIGEHYLKTFVDNLADEIVTKLNRETPVEQSMHRLFPESKDWVFQTSAETQYLQAAYGPRGAPVPVLPENPGRLENVRLELWLHTTTTEAKALAKLTRVPLARELMRKYLATILPELAALSENRSVDSVGEWLVISIGAPKKAD